MESVSKNNTAEQRANLQKEFKRTLLNKIEAIEEQCNFLLKEKVTEVHFSACHQLVDSMVSTAGPLGAVVISSVARELEDILKNLIKVKFIPPETEVIISKKISILKSTAENWQPSKTHYIKQSKDKKCQDNELSKKIYLVSDDELLSQSLILKLEQNKFIVIFFLNVNDFVNAFFDKKPDVIIMDLDFNEGNSSVEDVISQLLKEYEHIPPVVFISEHNDMQARLASARAGAQRYFCKPVDINKLHKTLLRLVKPDNIKPYKILLVDDDVDLLEYYEAVLVESGMEVRSISNPFKVLEALDGFKADLIILDVYMPKCSGPEIAKIIRQDDSFALTPIMFLSSESNIDAQLHAMNLGGESFTLKSISDAHLVSTIRLKAQRSRAINKINSDLKHSLRESQFQVITSNEHNIVSEADIKGNITYINEKFCEVSGYSAEELLGQNHRILKSNYHPESFYTSMWNSIANGKVWQGLICNFSKSGKEYWVESTIVPFLDDMGKPYKYVSARTDVTLVIQSEARLKQSQKFAKIGTWDWNIKTSEVYWSDIIWPLLGYKKEKTDATYDNFIAAIHPDDRVIVTEAIKNCIENNADYDIECRIIWPDKSIHWIHASGNVIRNQKGVALHMLGVTKDISEHKIAEEKLFSSEQRFKFAVEGVGDGVWDWNMKTNVVNYSPLWMNMLGYKENELAHTFDTFKKLVHPDDMPRVKQSLDDYLAKNKKEYNIDIRLLCKDKSYKWILSRGQVVEVDKNDLAVRMVGIHSDITAIKENEQKIIISQQEAEEANNAKSQFLSSMSHELRTPMNAIMGFGQLLQLNSEKTLSKNQIENVNEILKASGHLLGLINEVLDLAQIEAGKINLSIENIYLSDIMRESTKLIHPLAEKRGITISFFNKEKDASDNNLEHYIVRGDYTRLKQIFINLLSNAVKYNVDDGSVNIDCCIYDGKVKVSISDTGTGISKKKQKYLFTAFNRLGAEETEVEGTGIGLVITKDIVELMGGAVGFESEEGKGSTFWVELVHVYEKPGKKHVEETFIVNNTGNEKKYSVIYIEDNPANLRLVTKIFSGKSNIDLWSSHNPILGLELIVEKKPDLILLDINLPGMDGYEVFDRLQREENTRNIPVVAISANAMENDIKKGLEAGFDAYITKPIKISELLETIDKNLK